MGLHEKIAIEEDGKKVTLDLSCIDDEQKSMLLKYVLFELQSIPISLKRLFLTQPISQKNFYKILKEAKNSEIEKKSPKELLKFFRKLTYRIGDINDEIKKELIEQHFMFLDKQDLQEVYSQEQANWSIETFDAILEYLYKRV